MKINARCLVLTYSKKCGVYPLSNRTCMNIPIRKIKNFVIPYWLQKSQTIALGKFPICSIVPSYKPGRLTVELIQNLIEWNKDLTVLVVDDCTPESYENEHKIFQKISLISDRVQIIKTPKNKMKAGALNHGITSVCSNPEYAPQIIIILDDDVVIEKNTINNLVNNLLENEKIGAVCSQCRAYNKNKNILTRLQGLEYLGFNSIRLADEGFFNGPLVMHGMLTAYRTKAITEIGGFAENHLIEDYEITARLKKKGWHVRLAPDAYAWTDVPETFHDLWKQRVRWVYGGMTIVVNKKYWSAIIQDLIGHFMFIAMLMCIIASLFLINNTHKAPVIFSTIIISLSIFQLLIGYFFQLWFMRFYQEKDKFDWAIRLSIIPEFIYANLLTIVLMGAYVFLIFNMFSDFILKKFKITIRLIPKIERVFAKFGFTRGWGTKSA